MILRRRRADRVPFPLVDLHSHVLPGLDDGAATLDDSLQIARAAVADGVTILAATPHVREDHPTAPGEMRSRVEALRARLGVEGIALELVPGGEIAVPMLETHAIETLVQFALGGNPAYLLVETPYYSWPLSMPQLLFDLRLAGITPVLAHPERNPDIQRNPELLRPLVDSGVLVQLTAASLDDRGRGDVKATGRRLLQSGLAHLLASDAHRPGTRAAGKSAALSALGDESLARWQGYEMPLAIVRGGPLPERPVERRGRVRAG